jgi:effector-binding domain-containing protein
MTYQVEVKRVEPIPIAVVRRRAAQHELSVVVPAACGEVWNFIRAARIERPGRHVAVYLDGQINLEVGAEVPGPFQGDGQVVYSATPAGLVATTAHMGPYHLLGDAYAAINKWCADHQLTAAGPTWEIYGHWDDDPSKLRTDVFILLKEDGGPAG